MKKAILVLEDGTTFKGTSFGAEGEVAGEVVFNTQVVGYQEILTDPAYRGKLVSMGYPLIGNYGINDRCNESNKTHASALIVKENSRIYSNWQAKESLADFMKKNNVIGIEGIDTQAVTVYIRDNGEMRGIVSTTDFDKDCLVKKAKAYAVPDLVKEVQHLKIKSQDAKAKTIIINLGVNNSTLAKYPDAAVVSYNTTAEDILAKKPSQVVISSGPGDPTRLTKTVEEVKKLIGEIPIYGIQNGACVLALALGCTVSKMKVGHHGVNYPVVDPKTGNGEISMQNHSFGVDQVSTKVKVVHENLNDKTIEKFQTKDGQCVGTLYFPIDERSKLDPNYKYV
ncbi:MAG: glutamine-hydrolyzing carbamoyl-phosphate synthase small subunit [Candidatus Margulisbacteria bacterium]|nr:glutamine-hydrolyzing carbamoyl-phosphate synthase small subunit [Candidatus Margulisiibacteriota bacterium]MBU1021303.1 glutamine-hydrolyzing carbamoyl-phosphate synthase small subunit [Candidatus Margulisiibacteriota bacterium]MBU1729208.1 glutamine-hydrolyzing carbamoyl-phosphate synthase small subunit [Candidatus Margulisiibacteriota bacterium]MBU1954881.1 glutamine-hydrolyzing carbamoyl-phosphate synthase small subunit [Candidatus Margulisiibacteriota bacterium]